MADSIFNFNGADNAQVSAFLTQSAQSGQSAITVGGRARALQDFATGGAVFILRDTGVEDPILEADLAVGPTTGSNTLVFRYVADDNYSGAVLTDTGFLNLIVKNGSTQTVTISITVTDEIPAYVIGDLIAVQLELIGNQVTLRMAAAGNTPIFVGTYGAFSNQNSTTHGLRVSGVDSTVDRLVMEDLVPVTDDAVNAPPVATDPPDIQVAAGDPFSLNITLSDADGDPVTYSVQDVNGHGLVIADSRVGDVVTLSRASTPVGPTPTLIQIGLTPNDGTEDGTQVVIDVLVSAEATATSVANITIAGLSDGSHAIKLRDDSDDTANGVLFNGSLTFTNGAAQTSVNATIGTIFTGRYLGANPPTTGSGLYGVTV